MSSVVCVLSFHCKFLRCRKWELAKLQQFHTATKFFFYSHTLHLHQFAARWHGYELYYYFLSTWIRKITQFIMSGSILFLPPYTREEKNIWSELESNLGPLASQSTALTTRPWLLGLHSYQVRFLAKIILPFIWVDSTELNPAYHSHLKLVLLHQWPLVTTLDYV